jgi:choline dehydrogenase-like flavoprotein
MMWVRGFAADYDAWAEVAGEGWSWEALAPYFLRVEDTEDADASLGRGGPQRCRASAIPGRTRRHSSRRRASSATRHRGEPADRAGLLADDGHAAPRWASVDRRRLPAPARRRRGTSAS